MVKLIQVLKISLSSVTGGATASEEFKRITFSSVYANPSSD
jgi:hypothetical protein